MKLHQKSILILLLFLITLSSCSNSPQSFSKEMGKKFQTAIPVTDMNGSLQVKVESGEKIYPLGSEIPLTIINTSPHSIFLAIDSHIKLLMIEDAEWIEVNNVITYSGLLVISPQGTPL